METIAANVPIALADIEEALSLIEDAVSRLEFIAARARALLMETDAVEQAA